MSVVTPQKTDSVTVLAHQLATHPTTIVGSAIDCRTKRAAVITMYHGYIEDTADTNPGSFLVQVRPDDGAGSVNEHWVTVAEFVTKGTDPDAFAPSATENIGDTVINVPSTTGVAIRDLLYYQDTGVVADGEWCECRKFSSNTSITLVDGLTNAKDNADLLKNDASKFVCGIDLNGMEAFRVVWCHEGATGADAHIKALAVTYDSDLLT